MSRAGWGGRRNAKVKALAYPKPAKRSPKPRKRVPARRKGERAEMARQCAALWSVAVLRQNDGRCILPNWDATPCAGPVDPAHGFPKGHYPGVRYEPWNGLPVCRLHHDLYGNSPAWKAVLMRIWGPALYAERYGLACSTRKLDLAEVRLRLSA